MKLYSIKWIILFSLLPSTLLAGLSSEPIVFKSGNWSVHRSTDAMTDEITCTGVYKDNYGIQLNDDTLYIQVRGGVRGVKLRFGEQPPEELRLPNDMEKKIGVIMIQDNDFTKLLASNRLRAEAITVLDSVNDYDIDLTGITDALKNIHSGCSGQPLSESLPKMPSLCGDKVIQRLRAKKVSNEIIEYACSAN